MPTSVLVLIFVIIVICAWIAKVYNSLIRARNKVRSAFAQIDTQLQRRFDLIPNLIETVKGYAKHENELFETVTTIRSGYANATTTAEKVAADNQLTSTLKTLFAVSENYPELKANENFAKLQDDLKGTEDKIAFSRQFYNDAVTKFNDKLMVFPTNIIGSMFGFKEEVLFKTEEAAKVAPKVQF